MKINGIDEFINKFNADIEKRMEETLNKVGKQALKEVKKRTPIDSGRLRRSWKIKKTNGTSICIYNNTKYALPVEFGHRTRSSSKNIRYNAKTGSFYNKIKVVPGRFMLRDTIKAVKKDLKKEVKMMYEDIWK